VHTPPRTPSPPPAPPTPAVPLVRYSPDLQRKIRLLAAGSIVSAWLSLVVFGFWGIYELLRPSESPLAALTQPTGASGLGGSGLLGEEEGSSAAREQLVRAVLGFLGQGSRIFRGVILLVTAVSLWYFLLAAGWLLHLILEMAEHQRITAQALAAIARRTGG